MASSTFKSYLSQVIIVAAIVSVLLRFFFYFNPQYYFSLFPYLIVFFVVSTISIHYLLTSAANVKPQKFVRLFMMLTGGKLVLYFIVLGVVAFKISKIEVAPFVISFFIFYIVFTITEIRSVLKVLKASSASNSQNKL